MDLRRTRPPHEQGVADGLGTDYTYTTGGKVATRTWARGNPRISTSYSYNDAGDLAAVDYSDATLDLTYSYDRRGRKTTVVQGSGAYTTSTRSRSLRFLRLEPKRCRSQLFLKVLSLSKTQS